MLPLEFALELANYYVLGETKSGIAEDVRLKTTKNSIVIRSAQTPRRGWAESFVQMAGAGDDRLLDKGTASNWDRTEWEWK